MKQNKSQYSEYMFEKTNISINDYPEKEIILADLFHLSDGKTEYTIFEEDQDGGADVTLYEGRQEYLEWTSEGCASSLCSRVIKYMDAGKNDSGYGCIMVCLEPEVKS